MISINVINDRIYHYKDKTISTVKCVDDSLNKIQLEDLGYLFNIFNLSISFEECLNLVERKIDFEKSKKMLEGYKHDDICAYIMKYCSKISEDTIVSKFNSTNGTRQENILKQCKLSKECIDQRIDNRRDRYNNLLFMYQNLSDTYISKNIDRLQKIDSRMLWKQQFNYEMIITHIEKISWDDLLQYSIIKFDTETLDTFKLLKCIIKD